MRAPLLRRFGRGGVHPEPSKQATAWRPIERLPAPHEVRLPLLQHLGEPATPIVQKGDLVRRGQKIAEGGETGVPLHATISGKVKPIERVPHPVHASRRWRASARPASWASGAPRFRPGASSSCRPA